VLWLGSVCAELQLWVFLAQQPAGVSFASWGVLSLGSLLPPQRWQQACCTSGCAQQLSAL
jgi:hypothetical protein